MSVNADTLRAAEEPWSVTIDGRAFVARPVSWPAYIRWVRAQEAAVGDDVALERALRDVLRAAFPLTWRSTWWGRYDAVTQIERLSPGIRKAVLADFFDHLHSWARDRTPPSPSPNASGSLSSAAPRPSLDDGPQPVGVGA